MIVCHCHVVSDRDISSAIDDGVQEVCALASVCGAASDCGGCLPTVRQLLAERGCPPDLQVTVRTIRERLGLPPARTDRRAPVPAA
ncbi:(2Fe-2S)-binding protein [Salsipaludibacter albus]|uniref:(2Fe-2S)-binding protein n=1 Tax=Salsipaludibacter albus TaxID=2849650 RepID=UPI001EE4D6B4|nr:(2Fe-2S)-binding protein [Salsipaludibacter albus]MBY5164376.1 (2Fe-2S)-binding protein [Salsipaludibacter albus]